MAFSPQANYTDRVAAECRRSYYKLLAGRVCDVVSATDYHGH
jgi:hypothetical protein